MLDITCRPREEQPLSSSEAKKRQQGAHVDASLPFRGGLPPVVPGTYRRFFAAFFPAFFALFLAAFLTGAFFAAFLAGAFFALFFAAFLAGFAFFADAFL